MSLLCLFVINLGVAFGAGIYESSVVVPIPERLATQMLDAPRYPYAARKPNPYTALIIATSPSGRLARWRRNLRL